MSWGRATGGAGRPLSERDGIAPRGPERAGEPWIGVRHPGGDHFPINAHFGPHQPYHLGIVGVLQPVSGIKWLPDLAALGWSVPPVVTDPALK